MSKSQVALVRCENYQPDQVHEAIERGLMLLGGVEQFINAGEKILFKPNILVGEDPEKCIGPHPVVMEAVFAQFANHGVNLSYGDSPGFGNARNAAKRVGYDIIAEQHGVELADFTTPVKHSFPDGNLIKQFTIAKAVDECDGLISVSKLKSHALTRITGAIKNQFGCVPGALKAEFHSKLPNGDLFAQMLVDLNLMIKPRLYIMDGIMAMEGNGPRNGTPKAMNVLLFSTDPVALDTTVCKMVNLDSGLVEPIVYGEKFELGTSENIEYLGDDLAEFVDSSFEVNRAPLSTTSDSSFLSTTLLKNLISPRPVIIEETCTQCGRCIQVCPAEPKALSWQNGNKKLPPIYNYSDCIRCYCCQELCPHKAIIVKTPLLGRLIRR